MGNPFVRSEAFQHSEAVPPLDPKKGVLILVPGGIIGGGAMTLPPAGPDQQDNPVREVLLQDVPNLGAVRITYELYSYKHGRSKHWCWLAKRADRVEDRLG